LATPQHAGAKSACIRLLDADCAGYAESGAPKWRHSIKNSCAVQDVTKTIVSNAGRFAKSLFFKCLWFFLFAGGLCARAGESDMLRLDHNKDSQQCFQPPFAAGRGRQGNPKPMRQPDDKKQTSPASDTPAAASPREVLSHQEKVYFEMFRAIEQLGRKLEKAEAERYMLSRRLADIEQSAERDEETGRLYLPAKIEQSVLPPLSEPMPRVMQAAIAASFVIALCALGAVIMQDMPQKLSPQQLAALETLSSRAVQTAEWRKPAEAVEKPVLADAAPEEDIQAADVEMAAAATEASAPAAADKTEPAVTAAHDDEEAAEDFSAHLEDALSDLPVQTQTAAAENAAEETRPVTPVAEIAAAQPSVENKDVTVMTEGAEPSFAEVRAEDNTAEVLSEQAETAPAALAAVTPAAGHAAASVQASAHVQVAPVAAETKPQITAAPKQQETLPLMRDSRLPPPLQALEARAFEGYAEAQHDLAAAYADGRLAKQDYARARAWFTRAAAGGVAKTAGGAAAFVKHVAVRCGGVGEHAGGGFFAVAGHARNKRHRIARAEEMRQILVGARDVAVRQRGAEVVVVFLDEFRAHHGRQSGVGAQRQNVFLHKRVFDRRDGVSVAPLR